MRKHRGRKARAIQMTNRVMAIKRKMMRRKCLVWAESFGKGERNWDVAHVHENVSKVFLLRTVTFPYIGSFCE